MITLEELDFAMWAFGDKWVDYLVLDCDAIDLMRAWNRIHGETLTLSEHRIISQDMPKMKELWNEHNKRKARERAETVPQGVCEEPSSRCTGAGWTESSRLEYENVCEIHGMEGETMDKKMHQVTKRMRTAERDIKKGKKKAAIKVLKKAEKKNEKLVKIDRTKRDPLIEKAMKVKAKFPKDWGKVR